jgi:hypothetical protein
MNNDQNQVSTAPSNNDKHLNKVTDRKIKALEKIFESKMNVMEMNNDSLQKELAKLKKEKLQQGEENQILKQILAAMEAGKDEDTNNDLSYDSSDSGDNDTNYGTECSDNEEEDDDANNDLNYDSSGNDNNNDINYSTECSSEEGDDDPISTTNNLKTKNGHNLMKAYANRNYSSYGNEDPRNDIYLD